MKYIWKYEVPMSDEFVVSMPQGAEILCYQVQHDRPRMWALVDDSAILESRKFFVRGTGNPVEPPIGHYVGTVQWANGLWHLFVEKR